MAHRFNPLSNSGQALKNQLDALADRYNQPEFIPADPISIPHLFRNPEDISIAGLIAALFSWGQRKTILKKAGEFISLMGNEPHRFLLDHQETDLKPFQSFCHRTFNGTDAIYLIHFLSSRYRNGLRLENMFFPEPDPGPDAVETALIRFRKSFVEDPWYLKRSGKHVSSPLSNSACKRLNMFLRWMVRADNRGVDFGIWQQIGPHQLICPCDVHVERNARAFGLVQRPKPDWKMAIELTENLRKLDPNDPVRYDFALFGMGIDPIGPF